MEQVGQLASKLIDRVVSKDDEKEDYDPSDAVEQQQAELDKAEDEHLVKSLPSDPSKSSAMDDEKEVDDEEEEGSSSSDIDSLDEEAVVSSRAFGKEFESAIDHISEIAKSHRAEMISSIKEQIESETGQFVSDEMVSSAMRPFAVDQVESMDIGSTTDDESAVSVEESAENGDGDEEYDEEVGSDQMEEPTAKESQQILGASSCWKEALSAVRDLAACDQELLVNSLCDIHLELNSEEPSLSELHGMFSGIRAEFASEAVEMETASEWGSESESLAPSLLAAEMEVALVQVRKQAQLDQEGLVEFIMSYFQDFNGCDPTVEDMAAIFGRIKESFAEEEREEFLERNEDGVDSEEDSDYEYGESEDAEAEQYAEDEAEDVYGDGLGVEAEVDAAERERESVLDEEEAFDCLLALIDDEEEMVNEAVFEELWCSAMEHVARIGHEDGLSMMEAIVEQFEEETGQIATAEMVAAAMAAASTLNDVGSSEWAETESESEDEEEVAIEMALALSTVRELGALHAEQLVNAVIDRIVDEEGEEPSLEELHSIFEDVQDGLAEEEAADHDLSGELDHDSFAAEWLSAMDHIKMVALHHQEPLVDALCDSFYDQYGAEPSTPELYEIFAEIKASFAEEAADDLLEAELTEIERQRAEDDEDDDDDQEDSDYSPLLDAFDYSLDAVDDVLFHDSECDDTASSDSDYEEMADQEALQSAYAQDERDDVASSTDSDRDGDDENDHDEELGSDSEYSPNRDSADYYADYEAEHLYSADDDALSQSDCDDDDESGSEQEEDVSYNPDYDLFDYSADFDLFQGHSLEDENDDDFLDSSYSAGNDEYDYAQDVEDDFASSQELSASEDGEEVEDNLEVAA